MRVRRRQLKCATGDVILLDRSLFLATRIVAPVVAISLVPALAATAGDLGVLPLRSMTSPLQAIS